MKSRFLFVSNIILFFISLAAAMWFLGANIFISFDDFSLFFKNFPRYFEFFAFNVLIPGFISLLFTSFFGLNILKFIRDNNYSGKRKFKIFLPIIGTIITVLGTLLIWVLLILSDAEGLAFLSIFVFLLGGIILTVILGILGFFIDRNIISFIRFLKIIMSIFLLIIVFSIIIVAFNFLNNVFCLYSDGPCMAERAISEMNPGLCNKNYQCYINYIYFHSQQDSSICPSMPDKVDTLGGGVIFYNFRDVCYQHFAYKDDNVDLCNFVEVIPEKNTCLNHFAIRDKS